MSGVSGRESQVYPFKIPVVAEPGTSDMRIEYQYPKTEKYSNQATLKGEFKGPHLYKKELVQGFQKSYKAVMRKKQEFMSLVVEMSFSVSRYLVADTQRYSMPVSYTHLLCDILDQLLL